MKRLVGLILALLSVCTLITGCKAEIDEDEGCKWSAWTCTEEAKIGKKTTFESVCEDCSKKRTYRTRASKGLEYAENTDGTLTVTGIGSCDDEFLYIASEHNGKKVTAIGENAFDGARGIKYIYVSGGIEKIMPHAFIACSDLLCAAFRLGIRLVCSFETSVPALEVVETETFHIKFLYPLIRNDIKPVVGIYSRSLCISCGIQFRKVC